MNTFNKCGLFENIISRIRGVFLTEDVMLSKEELVSELNRLRSENSLLEQKQAELNRELEDLKGSDKKFTEPVDSS